MHRRTRRQERGEGRYVLPRVMKDDRTGVCCGRREEAGIVLYAPSGVVDGGSSRSEWWWPGLELRERGVHMGGEMGGPSSLLVWEQQHK